MAADERAKISKMDDAPYTLKEQTERQHRLEMLTLPHMKPLANYVTSMMKATSGGGYLVPNFDPLDGGIQARALFLLEAPGPKAALPSGSGFVSRNNPDPTAKNLWDLMQNANIPRSDTLIWNIVPWYVGVPGHIRPVTKQDIQEALPYLRELLDLLPHLQVIVLIGKKAQSASNAIRSVTVSPIIPTHHPSARVFNLSQDKKQQTQEKFEKIAQLLRENKEPHPCSNH